MIRTKEHGEKTSQEVPKPVTNWTSGSTQQMPAQIENKPIRTSQYLKGLSAMTKTNGSSAESSTNWSRLPCQETGSRACGRSSTSQCQPKWTSLETQWILSMVRTSSLMLLSMSNPLWKMIWMIWLKAPLSPICMGKCRLIENTSETPNQHRIWEQDRRIHSEATPISRIVCKLQKIVLWWAQRSKRATTRPPST